jgi:hypothetical protein
VHPILYKFEEIGWLESRFEEIEPARSAHFLLTIAVRLLPPSERARYLEDSTPSCWTYTGAGGYGTRWACFAAPSCCVYVGCSE